MSNKLRNTFIVVLIIQVVLFGISIFLSNKGYVVDTSIFISFLILMFVFREKLKIKTHNLIMFEIFFVMHSLGMFGFYNAWPFPVRFDYVIHFIGSFAFAYYMAGFLIQTNLTKPFLVIFVLLTTLGIGAIVEITEYLGYLSLGEGDGFLFFGAGDTDPGAINEFGGGWFNSMNDMILNGLGAICSIIIFYLVTKIKN